MFATTSLLVFSFGLILVIIGMATADPFRPVFSRPVNGQPNFIFGLLLMVCMLMTIVICRLHAASPAAS